jgi:hypothetical protein
VSMRAGDGFRFPNQKYDDSKALFVNFRYMQEYLNRIWANSKGAPDVIIAPVDGVDVNRADIVCNGENDEVQVLEAINRLPTSGGWVHLQAGNFYFGSALLTTKHNVRITGAGSATLAGTHPCTTVHSDTSTAFDLNDFDGMYFANLDVQGLTVGSAFGIGLADQSHLVLHDVSVRGFNVGISNGRGSSVMIISDCRISGAAGNGMTVSESTAFVTNSIISGNGDNGVETGYGANFYISNSQVNNNSGHGLAFGGPTQGRKIVTGCRVYGNTANGVRSSSNIYGPTIVSGCVVDSNGSTDIQLNAQGIAIGNWVDDAPVATVSIGNIIGGVAQAVDHGSLQGLADDDHTQYVLRSILTDDGDLFVRSGGVVDNLAVGTDGQVLTVDLSESARMKWADPTGGSGTSSNQEFRKIFLLGGM